VGNRCSDHVTPLYPQKLALTSPTGGGRSVGIVRSGTKAMEFSLVLVELEGSLLCSQPPVTLLYEPDESSPKNVQFFFNLVFAK
jgi:hypothetical protein